MKIQWFQVDGVWTALVDGWILLVMDAGLATRGYFKCFAVDTGAGWVWQSRIQDTIEAAFEEHERRISLMREPVSKEGDS